MMPASVNRGTTMIRRAILPIAAMCAFLLLAAFWGAMPAQETDGAQFDLVIRNGHIIDGTGSPWYSGDVGIRDGRIAAIGNLS